MAENLPITYKIEITDAFNQYRGTIPIVDGDLHYSQEFNTGSVQLEARVQLPIDRTGEVVEAITDESSNIITDEANEPITISRQPEYYEYLLDTFNKITITEFSKYNPNGATFFTGRITKYKVDTLSNTLRISALSLASDLDQIVMDNSGITTITKGNVGPSSMVQDAFGIYTTLGGVITNFTYDDPSGLTGTYNFIFMTMLEVIERSISLMPGTYYWRVHPGTNYFYWINDSTTSAFGHNTHTFIKGNHFKNITVEKSIERVKNVVYFTGGDTGGGVNLFKKYTDPQSIVLYGRRAVKLNDGRVTNTYTADLIGLAYLDQFKDPDYNANVIISASVYDISTINVGDSVIITGYGHVFDQLQLRVVRVNRASQDITLDLGVLPIKTSNAYEEVKRQLILTQTVDNPSSPS